jgi:predicted RNA-binding Zn-ribbon protein involved in translation (DUF1610 family)
MSKPIQIVIIVICLAAAGYLIFNTTTKESVETPAKLYHFQCANESCKAEWDWTAGQPLANGSDDPETCPTCNTEYAVQCAKCDACGGLHPVIGHGGSQRECPHCGASMLKDKAGG